MNLEYLLLPRLQVQAVNAQSTWWLINAAPVIAATLFAHNLGRKTDSHPVGVGIIHHNAQILGEKKLPKSRHYFQPQQRRGAVYIDNADYSSKNKYALSLQPTATCHLNWSLLLAYDVDDGLPSTRKLQDFLSQARLAGGHIVGHGEPKHLEDRKAVDSAVRSGRWLIERLDLMEGEGDPLDALIRATTQPSKRRGNSQSSQAQIGSETDPNSEPREGEQESTDWIVPATLGYAAISDFTQRAGAREGFPHAYAEPLVGLIQYVSVHQYRQPGLPLWRHTWLERDVFIVTQQEP